MDDSGLDEVFSSNLRIFNSRTAIFRSWTHIIHSFLSIGMHSITQNSRNTPADPIPSALSLWQPLIVSLWNELRLLLPSCVVALNYMCLLCVCPSLSVSKGWNNIKWTIPRTWQSRRIIKRIHQSIHYYYFTHSHDGHRRITLFYSSPISCPLVLRSKQSLSERSPRKGPTTTHQKNDWSRTNDWMIISIKDNLGNKNWRLLSLYKGS